MSSRIMICDIDNCISDDLWRHDLILAGMPNSCRKFHEYHAAAALDKAANTRLLQYYCEDGEVQVWFVTAAPQEFIVRRRAWLVDNLPAQIIRNSKLIMRPSGITLPSAILKPKLIEELLEFENKVVDQIVMALDDRDDVLEAYRAMGISDCRKVFIHEEACTHG